MTWGTTAGTAAKCHFATAKNQMKGRKSAFSVWRWSKETEEKIEDKTLRADELSCHMGEVMPDATKENKYLKLQRMKTEIYQNRNSTKFIFRQGISLSSVKTHMVTLRGFGFFFPNVRCEFPSKTTYAPQG